jgi:hypothetical protein
VSCATVDAPHDDSPPGEGADGQGIVEFVNDTQFTVKIVRGTGTVYEGTIAPGGSLPVTYNLEKGTIYYPRFYIPITKNYLYPAPEEQGLRPADHPYYQVDGTVKEQRIHIGRPKGFDGDSSFIVFSNNSNAGGVSLESPAGVLPCLYPGRGKRNVNAGETVVYGISPGGSDNLRVSPGDKNLAPFRVRPSFVYCFSFKDNFVTLTDARPLHRVGEPPWSRTLPDLSSPAVLTAEGAGAYALPSADYELKAAGRTAEGGLLTAGFVEQKDGLIPIARKEAEDGTLRWQLEPSRRADSPSAYYLALAYGGGDLWFAAGGADTGINEAAGFKAYLRCFRDLGASAALEWELGPGDFTEPCGAVKSLSWDAVNRRCLATGDFLNMEGAAAAYIAFINDKGEILKVDTGFRGFSFSRIISASDGSYYLIGEERKADGLAYAVLLKYNAEGELLWRTMRQPSAESYYQDAATDEDEGTIVLAGTMNGTDSYGSDGNPFIECVNTADGEREWIKALDEPVFKDVTLAAGIVKAPDYGYVLSLAGITNKTYRTPFIVARVNARGFYNIP